MRRKTLHKEIVIFSLKEHLLLEQCNRTKKMPLYESYLMKKSKVALALMTIIGAFIINFKPAFADYSSTQSTGYKTTSYQSSSNTTHMQQTQTYYSPPKQYNTQVSQNYSSNSPNTYQHTYNSPQITKSQPQAYQPPQTTDHQYNYPSKSQPTYPQQTTYQKSSSQPTSQYNKQNYSKYGNYQQKINQPYSYPQKSYQSTPQQYYPKQQTKVIYQVKQPVVKKTYKTYKTYVQYTPPPQKVYVQTKVYQPPPPPPPQPIKVVKYVPYSPPQQVTKVYYQKQYYPVYYQKPQAYPSMYKHAYYHKYQKMHVTDIQISDQEKQWIDQWIQDNNLDMYGNAQDTVYSGGTPLYNEQTGETIDRYVYIVMQHPDRPWLSYAQTENYTASNDNYQNNQIPCDP